MKTSVLATWSSEQRPTWALHLAVVVNAAPLRSTESLSFPVGETRAAGFRRELPYRGAIMEETGTSTSDSNPIYPPVIKGSEATSSAPLAAQTGSGQCPSCGNAGSPNGIPEVSYIYALGRVEGRFPRTSSEKEFAQATARADLKGKTDRQALYQVLKNRENRYLVRQLCWVLSV